MPCVTYFELQFLQLYALQVYMYYSAQIYRAFFVLGIILLRPLCALFNAHSVALSVHSVVCIEDRHLEFNLVF